MRIVVVGGFGDVGTGIVRRFLCAGDSVVAVGRHTDGVERLLTGLPADHGQLDTLNADLSDESEIARLVDVLQPNTLDAVIMSVHASAPEQALLEWLPQDLCNLWQRSTLPHLNAAQGLIPAMRPGSIFLGIGGGTADYVIPGIAALSLVQSSQRMMYRALAQEVAAQGGPHIRELIVKSMVNGHSSRAWAKSDWLTEDEIGARVFDIVANPDNHTGPILEMSVADRLER